MSSFAMLDFCKRKNRTRISFRCVLFSIFFFLLKELINRPKDFHWWPSNANVVTLVRCFVGEDAEKGKIKYIKRD